MIFVVILVILLAAIFFFVLSQARAIKALLKALEKCAAQRDDCRQALEQEEAFSRRVVGERDLLMVEVERLRLEATSDPLTGLLNRRGFELALAREQARASRETRVLVYFAVDLDRFKPINDTFGHAKGDEVLCAVAFALREVSRDYDLLVRLGGDEFGLMFALAEYDEVFVVERREQLRAAIWKITQSQAGVAVAASIGVGDSLQKADADLYREKRGDDTVIQ
jgi:diguanylate cyclase (GGDEF)-like protein